MARISTFIFGFFISCLSCNICSAQILPDGRRVDWSLAGLKETTTNNFTTLDMRNFGINCDGVTPNDQALDLALSTIENVAGLIIKFPAGNFLFSEPIVLPSNIVLKM